MKISVITVAFNDAIMLRDTLNNMRELRGKYHEYIIIDGGSTDNTRELISEYSDVVTKWVSEKDQGIYDAMNKGWLMADPESFIIYMGAGDKILALPSVDEFQKNTILYGDAIMEGRKPLKGKVNRRLKLGNTLHHQSLLIPKSLHPDAPFDCTYKTYADFDFNQRLLKSRYLFKYSDNLKGYAAAGGVSNLKLNIAEMTTIVLKNYGLYHAVLSKMYLLFQLAKFKILR